MVDVKLQTPAHRYDGPCACLIRGLLSRPRTNFVVNPVSTTLAAPSSLSRQTDATSRDKPLTSPVECARSRRVSPDPNQLGLPWSVHARDNVTTTDCARPVTRKYCNS